MIPLEKKETGAIGHILTSILGFSHQRYYSHKAKRQNTPHCFCSKRTMLVKGRGKCIISGDEMGMHT